MLMKALTVMQPWASLAAIEAKGYETRGWATKYRGPLAIHAGQALLEFRSVSDRKFIAATEKALGITFLRKFTDKYPPRYIIPCSTLPRGAVIATADLVECWEILELGQIIGEKRAVWIRDSDGFGKTKMIDLKEILFGDWTPGRFAWELANVKALPMPVPCRGRQGLWNWEVAA